MHDFKYKKQNIVYEKNVKNINNYQPRAHVIVIHKRSSVFTL